MVPKGVAFGSSPIFYVWMLLPLKIIERRNFILQGRIHDDTEREVLFEWSTSEKVLTCLSDKNINTEKTISEGFITIMKN